MASPVTFAWNPATDLDGDSITYRHYVWSVGKMPNYNDAEPVSIIQSEQNFLNGVLNYDSCFLPGRVIGSLSFYEPDRADGG